MGRIGSKFMRNILIGSILVLLIWVLLFSVGIIGYNLLELMLVLILGIDMLTWVVKETIEIKNLMRR